MSNASRLDYDSVLDASSYDQSQEFQIVFTPPIKDDISSTKAHSCEDCDINTQKLVESKGVLVRDSSAWRCYIDSCTDAYSRAIASFAAGWAKLMQERLNNGEQFEMMAFATSVEAMPRHTSSRMYHEAVTILALHWIHGENLRVWYNDFDSYGYRPISICR